MSRLWLLAAFAAHFASMTTLHAQGGDSVYAGRRCDKRLTGLQMPALAQLGDSARLDAALSRGADPQARMTWAELRFGRDGTLRGVDIRDARSSSARTEIRDTMRAAVQSIGAYPRDFKINLVRVNATGQIRLLAETATCEPEQHVTSQVAALIRQIHRDAPETNVHRDAVVQFILEADGHIGDAWIEVSTGFPRVDSLAMQLFRAMRFDPAIVGRTPVPALARQPFKF